MRVLDHERLDVYRVARELNREVHRLTRKARFKAERRDVIRQVYRSSASIPLNLSEGCGETSEGRKAYFYRIARGSATELAASLDYMVDVSMLEESDIVTAKALIVRIVSMLHNLTKSINSPDSYPPLPRRRTRH